MSHTLQPFISESLIAERISALGQAITRDYGLTPSHPLVIVGILKGAFMFTADLVRAIQTPHQIEFLALSSYGNSTQSSGEVKIVSDLSIVIEEKHVLIVEDIADTGLTLNYLLELLKARRPASMKICALLDKPSNRRVPLTVDYTGFEIPNHFVVGYGLDWAGEYRQLPAIYQVVQESDQIQLFTP